MENVRFKNGVTVGLNYTEKFQNRLARVRDVAQMHKLQDSRLQLSKQINFLILRAAGTFPSLWGYKLCRYEQDLRSISSKDFQSAIILNLTISHLSQGSSKPPPNKKSPGSQGLTHSLK